MKNPLLTKILNGILPLELVLVDNLFHCQLKGSDNYRLFFRKKEFEKFMKQTNHDKELQQKIIEQKKHITHMTKYIQEWNECQTKQSLV